MDYDEEQSPQATYRAEEHPAAFKYASRDRYCVSPPLITRNSPLHIYWNIEAGQDRLCSILSPIRRSPMHEFHSSDLQLLVLACSLSRALSYRIGGGFQKTDISTEAEPIKLASR